MHVIIMVNIKREGNMHTAGCYAPFIVKVDRFDSEKWFICDKVIFSKMCFVCFFWQKACII